MAWPSSLAGCAAVATFGFAIVPALDEDRRRAELADDGAGPLVTVMAAALTMAAALVVTG